MLDEQSSKKMVHDNVMGIATEDIAWKQEEYEGIVPVDVTDAFLYCGLCEGYDEIVSNDVGISFGDELSECDESRELNFNIE